MQPNRRIFEWLNPEGHWHEPEPWDGTSLYCKTCHKEIGFQGTIFSKNPDFTTFAGMEVLLKGLIRKGHSLNTTSYTLRGGEERHRAAIGKTGRYIEFADHLPDAVAGAVLKLIEQGETNGEK